MPSINAQYVVVIDLFYTQEALRFPITFPKLMVIYTTFTASFGLYFVEAFSSVVAESLALVALIHFDCCPYLAVAVSYP